MRVFLALCEAQPHGSSLIIEASGPAVSEDGLIITPAALRAAIQKSAPSSLIEMTGRTGPGGTIDGLSVSDDGTVHVDATVNDGTMVRKANAGVFRGVSVTLRIHARSPADPRVITGASIDAIALVDSPEALGKADVLWKAAPDITFGAADAIGRLSQAVADIEARLSRYEHR